MGDLIISVQALEPLSVYYPNQEQEKLFNIIVDYILILKSKEKDSSFFERLIDAMVYELYFPEIIKKSGCEVLKYISNLPTLNQDNEEQNLKIIDEVYRELTNPKHPIRAALLKLLNVEEVNIIEGRK
jgi:hypothetical protein